MSHHASRRASESQKRSSWDPEPLSPALPRSASSMASRDIPTRRPFPASPDFTTAAAAPDRLSTQQAQPSSSSVSVSHARSASQVRSTTNTTNWPNPPPKLGAAHPKWLLTALARPFYLLSRRGPAVPLFLVLSILLVLFLNQSSGSAPITTDLDPSSSEPRLAARPDELYAHIPPDRVAQPNAAAGLNRAGQGRVKGRLDKLKEIPGAQWAWEAGSRWAGLQHGTDQSSSSREGFLDDAEVGEEDPLWVPKGGGDSSSHKGRPDAGAAGVAEGGLFEGTDRAAALLSSGGKTRRRDGRLLIVEGQEHPIPRLIERAKRRWRKLNDKQSKTFTQAVREYMRRYGRNPPKGFDQWYAFARDNNVKLIDEFDLIERDLHAYRALSPASFRARVDKCRDVFDHSWGMRVSAADGSITREGELASHQRAQDVQTLCKRFKHALNTDMLLWYNGHDNSRVMIPWEEKQRLEQLVADGAYDTEDPTNEFAPKVLGPFPHWGVAQVCPPESALRAPSFEFGDASRDWTGLEMPPLPEPERPGQTVVGTFIDSFKGYLDTCENPQYRHFHSSTSWVYTHFATGLLPLLTPGVHSKYNDIHSLIVEQFEIEDKHDPTWHERPFDRVVWRGQTSGPQWDRYCAWISSHRSRLHLLSHNEQGDKNLTLALAPDQALGARGSGAQREVAHSVTVPNYRLNPSYLDTGMVGPPVQCIDETCDEMRKVFNGFDPRLSLDRSNLYKYALDIDGNSWSGRFRRLMLSHAAVLKATIYTEFWTDWAIPWLHFIPVQIDYSDIWDIMAFFRGGLSGEGAHDHLAQEIAENGRTWAKNYFRWQDLEAYQFRLMLEYGRLYAEDRENMDFVGEGDHLPEPVWIPAEGFTRKFREADA